MAFSLFLIARLLSTFTLGVTRVFKEVFTHLALTDAVRRRVDVDGEQHVLHGATFVGHGTSRPCVHVARQKSESTSELA